jgi:hypothetical protein
MKAGEALGTGGSLCHWTAMAKRTPQAGGFFILVGIVAGLAWGLFVGDPMNGVLIGTAAGVAAALIVWLIDRTRG